MTFKTRRNVWIKWFSVSLFQILRLQTFFIQQHSFQFLVFLRHRKMFSSDHVTCCCLLFISFYMCQIQCICISCALFLCFLCMHHAIIFDYDRIFMRRAVWLARKATGRTHPNPCVGCVIVNDQLQVIGEGYHEKCGAPHAEVNALRNAGGVEKTQNCTAYVSLEPCSHYGRTPPCTLALVK